MDTVTLTRNEATKLVAALHAIIDPEADFEFTYALSRTKRALKDLTESVREMSTASEAFRAYEEERMKLCREYASKDERGEPLVRGNQFLIRPDKQATFDRTLKGLQERNRTVLDGEAARVAKREEFMRGQEEFCMHRIDKEFVPRLPVWQGEAILPMIKTDEPFVSEQTPHVKVDDEPAPEKPKPTLKAAK